MRHVLRLLLPLATLTLAAVVPAAAQSASATVTASATVVEPISFAMGRVTVAPARQTIDVTTPVAVRGRAAHVVQVIRAGSGASLRPSIRPHAAETGENGATVSAWDVRLRFPRGPAADTSPLTYVISTVN